MKLTIGFSTCPNDTFIFDALVNGKIETEGLSFTMLLADIEELNRRAFENELDITKLSYHAYAYVSDHYVLLNSGSALGNNNGPLLISKQKIYPDELKDMKIAIPGKYTTANLLLGIAYPEAKNRIEYVFSNIEEAILSEEVDAGVIIHENRFTYKNKGLIKITDLGEYWENKTKMPIPLGCITIKRDLPLYIQQKISRVMRRSVEFALENPQESLAFVKKYAQEMDEEVMLKHIDLYVNKYSVDLGESGKAAIKTLYSEAQKNNVIPSINQQIFLS
ncbi:MAG: 1,4-dihydroxy-6-naphthoate synthase [Bacteroidia bacterium]|nr:1,4-dihydroxy-6-naphthoate synthase [Bacteroidia bacterium]